MKKILVVLALFAFQSAAMATELFPKGHTRCINRRVDACPSGTEFIWDDQGRCGCLSPDQYFDNDTCMRAMIRCLEPDETFHSVSGYRQVCDMNQEVTVGCGCFSEQKGFYPN